MQKTVRLSSSQISLSRLIVGTWQAGKDMWPGVRDEEIIEALEYAVANGVNAIDTAPSYGHGYSERLIARALGKKREDVYYLTKVSPEDLAPDKVISACEGSLRRLQTEYIDLYQIHWPAGFFLSEEVPISKTMSALNRLQEQGKIRAIGVSNFSLEQLQEAQNYAEVVSVQPPYSLFWRHFDQELRAYCEKELVILAYSPLAQGLLTGKFDADHCFPPKDHRRRNKLMRPPHFHRAVKATAKLKKLADVENLSLTQLSLLWVMSQKNTCAIVGVRNLEQIQENVATLQKEISSTVQLQMEKIAEQVVQHIEASPFLWKFPKSKVKSRK